MFLFKACLKAAIDVASLNPFSLNFYFICIHITLQLTTRHDKTSIHTNGIQKKVV